MFIFIELLGLTILLWFIANFVHYILWATSGFEIKVNGLKQADDSKPGSYAAVSRSWKSGDTVEVVMPFSLRTEGFRDNPRRVAFMYGPLVLCAETE